ncbi:hypothetical protein J0910_03630 [Nocardiopsis sp. CNT-189]|uniref:hypothetical protein n=1 Tax=Nocardiopsis oceanisediminis TaxID=2816862 RepID=UPI003B34CA02
MRTRAMEREQLHGPWPTDAEVLAADFPGWEISRDLLKGHGDWRAERAGQILTARTVRELRKLLEAAEGER